MRFTHRALAALMALALCLIGGAAPSPLFAVPVLAEEAAPDLEISVTVEPGEFIAPGEAELTFSLTNQTDGLLESVCLTSADGLLVEPIGDIAAGASQNYTRIHSLTQEELDGGAIDYIITCVADSDHFSYPVTAPIVKIYTDPEVEFLRQVSSRYCADGSSITIVYKLHNVGNVPVTAISVVDPLGEFDGRLEMLDVDQTKVFIQHISVTEAMDSAPVLTYSAGSEPDAYTVSLEPLTLEPARSMLDATLTAGRSIFASDTAEVILQLINGGNVDYLDVSVYDDVYGGVIADAISIPAGGEPVEVARSYPLRSDSSYRWRVTGRTSAGERFDLITNTESISLEADGGEPLLAIEASTAMPHINRGGYVPIRLEISNIGDIPASSVRICEAAGADVFELAVVPLGDSIVREIQYKVTESTSLIFSAIYTDSFGKERIAAAAPVEITIGPGGQPPLDSQKHRMLFGGIATQMPNSGLFMALLIGSCLVLAVLIVVLAITSRRARIRRRAKKMRIKAEMGKTNRFRPVRAKGEKKPASEKKTNAKK